MGWPFESRRLRQELADVKADRERIRAERNQFAKDRDAFKYAAETAAGKYTDTAIVNDCLTEDLTKARAKLAEYSGRRTVSDVLEEHDVHRKALADALGEQKWHLNWDQLITEVVQLNKAAHAWMADYEAAKERAELLEKVSGRSEEARLKRRVEHLERQLDDATKGGDQGTGIRKSWGLS